MVGTGLAIGSSNAGSGVGAGAGLEKSGVAEAVMPAFFWVVGVGAPAAIGKPNPIPMGIEAVWDACIALRPKAVELYGPDGGIV